jgi:hypothetical protein
VGRPGNRHFKLKLFIIGAKDFIGDWPIDTNTVPCMDFKVRWVQARGECGPVDGASADTLAAVVGAQGKRVIAAGNAWLLPVEVMRADFVGDPVTLGIPKGSRL